MPCQWGAIFLAKHAASPACAPKSSSGRGPLGSDPDLGKCGIYKVLGESVADGTSQNHNHSVLFLQPSTAAKARSPA